MVIREITDNSHNIFLGALERPGLTVQRTGFPGAAQGKTLESEWGLALHIETTKGSESRRYLLDFGFTAGVYANNLDLLKIDPAGVDALIVSHGHFDHYGGLVGFLEARRAQMRKELRLIPAARTFSASVSAATPTAASPHRARSTAASSRR